MMITREALQDGWLERLQEAAGDSVRLCTEDELAACRADTLKHHPPGEDVWVFAYGSLIWNPAFHFAEKRRATIHGYHRAYCLWTHLGRGSEEYPGLMLGLDHGGACAGLAYRLTPAQIEEELPLVWRREMLTRAYRPTWLSTRIDSADGPINCKSIGFVINRHHDRYACGLTHDELVETLSRAQGPLGTCAEYLFNTNDHLLEIGIHDRGLDRLAQEVRAKLAVS